MNKEEQYILLSKLFGACLDMVQGAGGNISIKNGDTILIKASGFTMANTTDGDGYVLCDLHALRKKFEQKDIHMESTVLHGRGKPSMETFFHLLPANYIVHIHPTSMLNLLCRDDLRTITDIFPDALCIPYVEPGFELAEVIHKVYDGQRLIFLQNHGVIFLDNDLDSLISLIDNTFQTIKQIQPSHRISDIGYIYSRYLLNTKQYIKPSFLIPSPCRLPRIKSYTPDLHLFVANDFEKKVHLHNGYYYLYGPTKESVENFEQIFASYFLCHFQDECVQIPLEQTRSLEKNPLEKVRLTVFKQDGTSKSE